jgi:release factor glutamine methyltransferase
MTEPVSIETALRDATEELRAASESPRLDAELLMCRAIDMPRSYLFAHPEDTPDDAALERFHKTLERRLGGEPMAYITGTKEFWSLEFMVTPATLVPRPETEILVDLALREIPRKAGWNILDLGTGSGAIAIAIAKERPFANVTAIDVSNDALAVARVNARQHDVGNIEFLEGNWAEPARGRRFDLVVSNPPYVAAGDPFLESLGAEPEAALVAGEDGMEAIEVILRDCRDIVVPNGKVFLEHGSEQAELVMAQCLRYAWVDIRCHNDYAGLPRVTEARNPEHEETT